MWLSSPAAAQNIPLKLCSWASPLSLESWGRYYGLIKEGELQKLHSMSRSLNPWKQCASSVPPSSLLPPPMGLRNGKYWTVLIHSDITQIKNLRNDLSLTVQCFKDIFKEFSSSIYHFYSAFRIYSPVNRKEPPYKLR